MKSQNDSKIYKISILSEIKNLLKAKTKKKPYLRLVLIKWTTIKTNRKHIASSWDNLSRDCEFEM